MCFVLLYLLIVCFIKGTWVIMKYRNQLLNGVRSKNLKMYVQQHSMHTIWTVSRKLNVKTNHHPLEAIFSKPLYYVPTRIQRLMIQIQPYDLSVCYSPSPDIPVADALSHFHLPDINMELHAEAENHHSSISSKPLVQPHATNFGMEKIKQRAHMLVYWPGLNLDIENYVQKCKTCTKFASNNTKELMTNASIPILPWQHISIDLFE
ncbi:hypothetical protein QYM36_001498 [Artemia franciscana]|uniref:RNA-directed DNA polymerase n=1 Tax=Artemia franciscana TaxID=6661 RepID=A0AA88IP02_ARTSF|nr:hypothetical protein QYM36_001498 [Artemia franciscana]